MDDDQKQSVYVGVIAFTWTVIIWELLIWMQFFGAEWGTIFQLFLGVVLAAVIGGAAYFVMQMNQ